MKPLYKKIEDRARRYIYKTTSQDAVLDMTQGAYLDSAAGITIEGVTIKTSTGMSGSDYAALFLIEKAVFYIIIFVCFCSALNETAPTL